MNKKKAGIACVLPDWRKPAYLTHKIKKRCNFQKSLCIIKPCIDQRNLSWFGKCIRKEIMHRKNKPRIAFYLFMLVFCAGFLANAQMKVKAQEKPDSKSSSDEYDSDEQPAFHISVNVEMVELYATVVDKKNHFVSGLEKSQFRVLEDGVEQTIQFFSHEQEYVPMSMGIVLDLSGSMQESIRQVKQAALTFLQAGKPGDEFFLVGFSDGVRLLHDYTSDINAIGNILKSTENIGGGGTSLYDAIYLSVKKAQTGSKSKKALVVITDGGDNGKFHSLETLIAQIRESDVQVFCIGLSTGTLNTDPLESIAKETGGNAYFPVLSRLRGIVDEIARDLRGQYSIGYYSANPARDGAYRTIKIELTGNKTNGMKVRHRNGYFARK